MVILYAIFIPEPVDKLIMVNMIGSVNALPRVQDSYLRCLSIQSRFFFFFISTPFLREPYWVILYSLINSHNLFLCDKYIILITSLVRHDFNSVTTLIDENIRDRGSSLQTTINYSAADEVLRTRCIWTAKNSTCLGFFFSFYKSIHTAW